MIRMKNRVNNNLIDETNSNATMRFYMDAKIDNFARAHTDTWHTGQRYYVDESLWCGSGCPIFVMVGGESPQGPPSEAFFMHTLAKEHKALMVSVEHRFYGQSQPLESLEVANLNYLSSQQALADLARIITYIKSNDWSVVADKSSNPPLTLKADAAHSPVITFGGSYPGALSSWFRLKYPDIAVGAVASSAPVYAEANFDQYAEVVGRALASTLTGGSPACAQRIEAAVTELYAIVSKTPYGSTPSVPRFLKPCTAIRNDLDLSQYASNIFGPFQGTVQYNGQTTPTIAQACAYFADGRSPLEQLNTFRFNPRFGKCVDASFDEVISALRNVDNTNGVMRQWIWQSCQEFGFFQTATSKSDANLFHALGDILDYNRTGAEICKQAYDLHNFVQPTTAWTNSFYGARAPGSTNVAYVTGNADPWNSLGIVNATSDWYNSCVGIDGRPDPRACTAEKVSSTSRAVEIAGTSHCRDMMAPDYFTGPNFCPGPLCAADTGAIQWAHQTIADMVASFLKSA